jgi:hypothetical protein
MYGDQLNQEAVATQFLTYLTKNKKGQRLKYIVVVEKATGTEPNSTHHKREAYIVLENWLSVDHKYVMLPNTLPNPFENQLPRNFGGKYFLPIRAVPAAEMEERFARYPYPLSRGFVEFDLEGKLSMK